MSFKNDSTHLVSSICLQKNKTGWVIGFSYLDTNLKYFSTAQFFDYNSFSTLESILLQVRPSCCALYHPSDTIDKDRLCKTFDTCDVEILEVPKNYFSATNLEQDLSRLLRQNDSIKNHPEELSSPLCCQSLACLISKWSIISDISFINRSTLNLYELDRYLRLDKASFSALSIFPLPGEGKKKSTSLFGLLNKCKTQLGSRRLEMWISQPLVDIEEISIRLDIVELLLEDHDFRVNIHANHLKKVPDLDVLLGKFHSLNSGLSPSKSKIQLEDIVKLYDCVVEAQGLLQSMQSYDGIHSNSLSKLITHPLSETLEGFKPFLQLVEHTIDLKEAEKGTYVISSSFDPKLQELSDQKERILNQMEKFRSDFEDSVSFESGSKKSKTSREDREIVKIIVDNTLGFVFRVTKKDHPSIQSQRGIQSVRLNKAEFLFTTQPFKNLVKAHDQCCSEYNHFQSSLVEKTLRIASTYWPALENMSEILATIDILASFALVASSAPSVYIRPVISNNNVLKLIGSRHAILEAQATCTSFIPNDIEMIHDKSRLHVITGPNMGGKSTYIRQVAMCVLMAQIGCFVPCKVANIPIFSSIMCRVGASDIQLKGISTFLAEMVEASAILNSANKTSLVIIDELGRGTSTFEGFGLAWAIAKYLLEKIQCYCLFATHFHEMGMLAQEYEGAVNSHVSALVNNKDSNKRLTFLYQIDEGQCDQSYGVDVAQMANLPEEVVKKAQQKSEELESAEKLQTSKHFQTMNDDDIKNPFKRLKSQIQTLFQAEDQNEFYNRVSNSIYSLQMISNTNLTER